MRWFCFAIGYTGLVINVRGRVCDLLWAMATLGIEDNNICLKYPPPDFLNFTENIDLGVCLKLYVCFSSFFLPCNSSVLYNMLQMEVRKCNFNSFT